MKIPAKYFYRMLHQYVLNPLIGDCYGKIFQIAPTPKEQESWLPKTAIFASLYETLNSICNIEGEEDSTHELAKGQLISKCVFGVIVLTKMPTKFL